MIKMIAFDLDGTTCDSIPLCISAFQNAVLPYIGFKLSEQEIVKTFGVNEAGMIKAVVNNQWESALHDFYIEYERLHSSCPAPFEGIVQLIRLLKDKKIIVPLITGKGLKSCRITLEKIELENVFDDIMCGTEVSSGKRENMLILMKKYRIQPNEFLYIGDTVSDIRVCDSVGITCLSAAWSEKVCAKELKELNPNYFFQRVEELESFIKTIL